MCLNIAASAQTPAQIAALPQAEKDTEHCLAQQVARLDDGISDARSIGIGAAEQCKHQARVALYLKFGDDRGADAAAAENSKQLADRGAHLALEHRAAQRLRKEISDIFDGAARKPAQQRPSGR